ncbi:Uncharacterized conserved protein, DUF2252 family [Collimonas sp. OK307]|uniref:DUF2252 domain-containing protein n=1 Tax=Collimonas sp. OK307 TaxID=1801620 RepID=UPI0008EC304D|nr:DUF2252 domain-containing protein [Collimonas sp. OK307]SFH64722.1 Uncharacterized conserved protein, DUF2252 family [Collimonas sp. OK307]
MVNVVKRIQEYNAGRDPQRLQMKYKNIRNDPFTFLRGTCHLFYERLPQSGVMRSAPPAWICGDLHLENFGSYKGDNRLAYFDLNDFDESVLAPVSWEMVRLLTSVLVAAHGAPESAADGRLMCRSLIDAYGAALVNGKPRWIERDLAHGMVGDLLSGLRGRQRAAYLDTRTVRKGKLRTLRVDDKKALPVSIKQRAKVTAFMKRFASEQANPDFYKVLDVARRIAGTGSLGVERYVILVQGKGSPDGNYLLDLKQALPSSLTPYLKVTQPKWKSQAQRVVTLQRRCQAVSMAFLQPVMLGKVSYVLRGLQPSEDRVTVLHARHTLDEIRQVMTVMGNLAAWAQLRSAGRQGSANADELIAFGTSKKWKKQLLDAALTCAAQVQKDWQTYSKAYDAGAFEL